MDDKQDKVKTCFQVWLVVRPVFEWNDMKYAKHMNDMELKCLSVERKVSLAIKRKSSYDRYTVLNVSVI